MVKNCYKLNNLMDSGFEHYVTKYFSYEYTVFISEILLLAEILTIFSRN